MESRLPKLVDPRRLASRSEGVEGVIPLDSFTRLGANLSVVSAPQAKLVFNLARGGRVAVSGALHGEFRGECQRCLRPVEITVNQEISVEVTDASAQDTDSSGATTDFEETIEYRSKLNLHELVEDEFVLACPIVPLHPAGECAVPAETEDGTKSAPEGESNLVPLDSTATSREKPFAELAEMLAAKKSNGNLNE